MHKIFVYGTLKQDWGNHWIIEGQEFVGTATSRHPEWQMYSLGGFPGIVNGDKKITGELYEVDDEAFARCDRLEGHPSFYKRVEREFVDSDGTVHTAWVYVYQGSINGCKPIEVW